MDIRIYERYVREIAEKGSLTKAAASLGISQPALSLGITNLEKELGIRIFNRRSVPVSFTAEGEIYFEYLRKTETLEKDFRTRIDGLHEDIENKVAIGGPGIYVDSVITDAVVRLKRRFPGYEVTVESLSLPELTDRASKGLLHCFVSTTSNLPENFELRRIFTEKIFMAIPKNGEAYKKLSGAAAEGEPSVEADDFSFLNDQEFIFLEKDQPLQEKVLAFLRERRIRCRSSITVNRFTTALRLTSKGAGISFIPEEMAGDAGTDHICFYPLPENLSGRDIYIAYDRDFYMTKACRELIRTLTGEENA